MALTDHQLEQFFKAVEKIRHADRTTLDPNVIYTHFGEITGLVMLLKMDHEHNKNKENRNATA